MENKSKHQCKASQWVQTISWLHSWCSNIVWRATWKVAKTKRRNLWNVNLCILNKQQNISTATIMQFHALCNNQIKGKHCYPKFIKSKLVETVAVKTALSAATWRLSIFESLNKFIQGPRVLMKYAQLERNLSWKWLQNIQTNKKFKIYIQTKNIQKIRS